MKSFGLWYKATEETNIESTCLELHVNLWNINKTPGINKADAITPFIDFGFRIKNFRNLDELRFLIPFTFEDIDLEDLFDKMKEPDSARLIFNDNNCNTASISNTYCIKDLGENSDQLLLMQIKKGKQFTDDIQLEEKFEEEEGFKICSVRFDKIKANSDFDAYNNVYFRFRINAADLKKILFCNLEKKNYYLESGFETTQIIDLKINKERNLPHEICDSLKGEKFNFMRLHKIHFFVMDSANNNVTTLGNDFIECRKLEEKEWISYLDHKYITKDVLVYHWKETENNNESIKEYSKLVKITMATTRWELIIIYLGIVVLLSIVGNCLFTWLAHSNLGDFLRLY